MTARRIFANAVVVVLALAGAFAVGACGGESTTRVQLTIDRGGADLDDYQLRIASATVTRSARAEVIRTMTLVLPDEMGGAPATIEVWGLQVGMQRAYGKVTFTPQQGALVGVTVTLTMVSCELWCEPGSTACESDGLVTCTQDASGCFTRGAPEPCPGATPFCSNGACAATCSDECADGETSCDSAVALRACGQFDSDSCLDWSAPMACPSGESCSAGECSTTTATCSDGAECDDGNACTTDDTCAGGACSGIPACPDAPPHGTPTCGANGACGFACDVGFVKAGDSCMFVPPAEMPTPRGALVVIAAGGKIYAMGGYTSSGSVGANEAYDPATNTWQTRAPMPTPRTHAAAVLGPDGKIYVIGGSPLFAAGFHVSVVEAYDPATNTWETRAPMPTARDALAAAVGSDGLIYAIGGRTDTAVPVRTVEAFDPVANTWSQRAPLPAARFYLVAVSVGDRIFAIGGSSSSTVTETVAAYDPILDTWTPRATMPSPRAAAAAAVGADGAIYVFGMWTTAEALAPDDDVWLTRAAMPTGRAWAGAARGPNRMLYVIGGFTDTSGANQYAPIEVFDPTTNTWP